MEVWLSLLLSGALTAIAIVVGAIIGGYQISKAAERIAKEMSDHIGKAIEAIHADIKHSQEKLERRIEK